MVLERETAIPEILNWIRAEATAKNIPISVSNTGVEERTEHYSTAEGTSQSYRFVGIRVCFDTDANEEEQAALMVNIEDAWNDRHPQSETKLWLIPFGLPQGVW